MNPTNATSECPNILKDLLDACRQEYSDRWDNFKQLDSKAHNLIGVAGVLLSAVLVSLRIGSASLDFWILPPLLIAVASLVVAIWLGAWSQRVSNVRQPINLSILERIAGDLMALQPDELAKIDVGQEMGRTLLRMCGRSLTDVSQEIRRKGNLVRRAQISLLIGVSSTGVALAILIWSIMRATVEKAQ